MSNKEENESEIPAEVKNEKDAERTPGVNNVKDATQEESKTNFRKTSESKDEAEELIITELNELLSKEKQNLASCEEKLKRSLADFENLQRKTKSDIENGVNTKIDQFMVKFLQIYDDFVRAKTVFTEQKVTAEGFESILKNMDSLLSEYNITSINSLGEIFDPNLHEAIAIVEDETLDENTITKEIRKGYISHKRVIRSAIVEISKKPKSEESKGEING